MEYLATPILFAGILYAMVIEIFLINAFLVLLRKHLLDVVQEMVLRFAHIELVLVYASSPLATNA